MSHVVDVAAALHDRGGDEVASSVAADDAPAEDEPAALEQVALPLDLGGAQLAARLVGGAVVRSRVGQRLDPLMSPGHARRVE